MNINQCKINLPSFLIPFFLFLIFVFSIFPITDNDVWWHLTTGKYIFQNNTIPHTDIFSYTIYGKQWISFEWLAQLIFFTVYFLTGLSGLIIFKAIISCLIFYLILLTIKNKSEFLLTYIILCISFIIMRDWLRERPQLFTYFFSALYMYIFNNNAEKTKHKMLYSIPLIQLIWANMHGPAAIIGYGIICIYTLFSKELKLNFKIYLTAGSFLAMFINPNTWHIFSYLKNFFSQNFNHLILEYQPPVFSSIFLSYYILVLIIILSLFLPKKRKIEELLIIIFAITGSFLAARNIVISVILCVPITLNRLSYINKFFTTNLLKSYWAAFFTLLIFILLIWPSKQIGFGDAHKSRYAMEFIKQCNIKGNIFNDYDFGGYLIWKFYPENKVFIDGRLVEYGADFVEKSFYYWKPEIWNQFDSKYNFTSLIIPMENYYASSNIDLRNNWILVYWDDGALVYLKKIPENKKLINVFGYRILKPGAIGQQYLKLFPKNEVLKEINRSLYFAPHSIRAKKIKSYIEK